MIPRDYIQKLVKNRYAGEVRNAFIKNINDIAKRIKLGDIEQAIKQRDIQRAVEIIDLTQNDFEAVKEATANGFNAAGNATTAGFPAIQTDGQKTKIIFNPGSRRAVQAVNNLHTNLIREVSDETRGAIAQHISDGLSLGKNPRVIAKAIRGGYNPATKSYDNGAIGLTKHQQGWVSNAEAQLSSGDPREMRKYLSRKLRDPKYDRTVLEAINEERALTQKEIDNMTKAYRRRAVTHRAETIGRDQALEACTEAQEVAMDEAVDQGAVQNQDFIKEWVTSGDARVRDVHKKVPGMNRGGIRRDEMFNTPLGQLKRPRDRSSPGSVPSNVIQCRCSMSIRIRRQ